MTKTINTINTNDETQCRRLCPQQPPAVETADRPFPST